MNAVYELKNGGYLELFLGLDILKGKPIRKKVSAIELDHRKARIPFEEHEIDLKKGENGFYVVYSGEKIYINDYVSLDIKDLNDILLDPDECDNITSDEILAFLHREYNNVAFLCTLLSRNGNYEDEVLCAIETKEFPKEEFCYRVHIIPESIEDFYVYRDELYYFSDFVRKIKKGSIKIVDKEEYKSKGVQKKYHHEVA